MKPFDGTTTQISIVRELWRMFRTGTIRAMATDAEILVTRLARFRRRSGGMCCLRLSGRWRDRQQADECDQEQTDICLLCEPRRALRDPTRDALLWHTDHLLYSTALLSKRRYAAF